MGGLFQKALMISERGRQPQTAGDSGAGPGGISSEERQKIASRIDRIMSENRIEISPEALAYKPKRRGATLPVVTNVSVLLILALAAFLISYFLNRQENDIATGRMIVQGAENQLIEALKQDSERRLREKDQAILATRQKLGELGAQAEKLKSQADSLVTARSDELQRQFDQKMQAEKERLQKAGLTASAEAERLRQYEAAQRQALEQQVLAARRQADADLAAQQKSLAGLTAQYQKQLDAARQERLSTQDEAVQKQEELRRQYAQDKAAAQGESARVNAELARMQADRQKEQLVLDQVYAGYDQVNRALQASDYAGALSSLGSIRGFFDSPDVGALPTIQKRRPAELFLVSSLEELIRNRQAGPAADAAVLVRESTDLKAVSDLVARGDALSQNGDLAGAREAYLSALQKIPLVGHGYARLEQLKPPALEVPALISGLRQANVFYQAGNLAGSVEQYRQAVKLVVKDDALARQITDNVMNAGYHLLAAADLAALSRLKGDEEKRQAVLARLQDIRTQYRAYTQLAPQASLAQPSDQSLASLLQAKILIRQVLESEPVRTKYPGLSGRIEQYFSALEQQGREEGRKAASDEMNAVLDRLAATAGSAEAAAAVPASAYASPSSGSGGAADPLVALLDRLETVLSGN